MVYCVACAAASICVTSLGETMIPLLGDARLYSAANVIFGIPFVITVCKFNVLPCCDRNVCPCASNSSNVGDGDDDAIFT